MYSVSKAVHEMKATLTMVVIQVAFAGVNILYKLTTRDGMNPTVVVAYRFMFATAFLAPVAFFLERKSWPKITWIVLVQAFFCGLFGQSMGQCLYLTSLSLTSATYASAMANLIPAMTFVLAVSFGLEKLRLRTVAGQAKVAGTLMGVGGAMLLTFYKGMEVNLWSTHVNLLRHVGATQHRHEGSSNLLVGSLLAVVGCFCYALWLIIQAKMSEGFPYEYTSTALMNFMASIQVVVYTLCQQRDWSQWKLGWNVRLLTVSYSGIVASGLCYSLITWCVRVRGPVFVSIFNPLVSVMVALAEYMLLDEKLHLGSILGAGLIVIGLYAVLWGKGKEKKRTNLLVPLSSSGESKPIEIAIASPNKSDVDERDDVQGLRTKELNETIEESFEEKRGGGGGKDQVQRATDLG